MYEPPKDRYENRYYRYIKEKMALAKMVEPSGQTQPCNFLGKLPLEMRRKIYRYVLAPPRGKPITLVSDSRNDGQVRSHPYGAYGRVEGREPFPDEVLPFHLIIVANKQIHEEAIEILYEQKFKFKSLPEMGSVLSRLGSRVKWLREIQIEESEPIRPEELEQCLGLLRGAAHLRHIHLRHEQVCEYQPEVQYDSAGEPTENHLDPEEAIQALLKKGFLGFLRNYKPDGKEPKAHQLVDMLKLYTVQCREVFGNPYHSYSPDNIGLCGCRHGRQKRCNQQLQVLLRAVVVRELGYEGQGTFQETVDEANRYRDAIKKTPQIKHLTQAVENGELLMEHQWSLLSRGEFVSQHDEDEDENENEDDEEPIDRTHGDNDWENTDTEGDNEYSDDEDTLGCKFSQMRKTPRWKDWLNEKKHLPEGWEEAIAGELKAEQGR